MLVLQEPQLEGHRDVGNPLSTDLIISLSFQCKACQWRRGVPGPQGTMGTEDCADIFEEVSCVFLVIIIIHLS